MSPDPAARFVQAMVSAAGDESGAVAMARGFGLGGFVARHLGVEHLAVRAERLALRLHNTLLREVAAEASNALSACDVPHFVGKGVAFIGDLYQPGDREAADLDLWIHPDAVAPACDALRVLGYREAPGDLQSGPASLRPGALWYRGATASLDAVSVDLHWGMVPVTRILPRVGAPLPADVWQCLDRSGPFPVPDPGHHAALLIHHLVHHDLLHIRGLLDLALLWHRGLETDRLVQLARHLNIWRAARAIRVTLARDLAVRNAELPAPPADWRGRRLADLVCLDGWLTCVAQAPDRDRAEMTPRRLVRRAMLLDRARDIPGLLADAVWPPAEHLRWRWPRARTLAAARWQHARQVLGKLRQKAAMRGDDG